MNFQITSHSETPTRIIVKASHFTMIIDEPENLGGEDTAPNPLEYLLASLSGCLNVVGHIVAKELGFKFDGLSLSIDGDINPLKFMGQPSDERTGFKNIKVQIKLNNADVAKDVLDTWLKLVEERCPVTDNIRHATPLSIEIV